MTILLVGGTGLLGGAIAEELARHDKPVRALVRSGKRTARLRMLANELDVGDLRDPRSLRRVLGDVTTVITTAQSNPFNRHERLSQVDGAGNHNLIAAARDAGVERFILISALKASEGARNVPQLAYKYAAEQALKASGMAYTILRPSSFQETFGSAFAPFKRLIDQYGIGLTLGQGHGRHSFVAVRDVARAVPIVLDRPEARNAVMNIGGIENLSYRDAYARIAQLTGRNISIVAVPRPVLWSSGLLAAPLLPDLAGFFDYCAFFEHAEYMCHTPLWLSAALGPRRTFDEGIREMYHLPLLEHKPDANTL